MSRGDAVREVISQVPAVSCIQVPMEEMVLAIQRSRKRRILSGAKPLGLGDGAAVSAVVGDSKGIAGYSLRGWMPGV
jgi:hypothetical protein